MNDSPTPTTPAIDPIRLDAPIDPIRLDAPIDPAVTPIPVQPEAEAPDNTIPFAPLAQQPAGEQALGTPVPADAPEAEGATPPAPPAPVAFEKEASVEWLNDDGTVEKTERVLRSSAELVHHLSKAVTADKSVLDRKVRIMVKAEEGQPLDKEGKAQTITTEGTVKDVARTLIGATIPSQAVMDNIQDFAAYSLDHSSLKGLVVTAVFGKCQPAGFGLLTSTCTLTDQDIVALITAAEAQVAAFKERVKTLRPHLMFPGESKILGLNGRPV